MCIGDLDIDFEKLESTESVDLAQAATETSHKEWQSVDISGQKYLSNLFSSGRALKEKQALKTHETFKEYYNRGRASTRPT